MSKPPKSTFRDIEGFGEDSKLEVIDGEIVQKAGASVRHGAAQLALGGAISAEYGKRGGGNRTGGWWIASEVQIELAAHEIYIPDLAGWRRENLPALSADWPVRVCPDWVCEVLSKSNAGNDRVKKFRGYHAARVPHYWIVDPREESLIVHRYTPEGYLAVLMAGTGDTIRAEPFDALEIHVGELFGYDA